MENDLKSVNAKKSTGKTMASNEDDDDASTDIASNLYERPAVTKKASQRPTSSNVNVGTSGKRNLLLDHQPDRVQRHLEALEVKYKDILSVQ